MTPFQRSLIRDQGPRRSKTGAFRTLKNQTHAQAGHSGLVQPRRPLPAAEQAPGQVAGDSRYFEIIALRSPLFEDLAGDVIEQGAVSLRSLGPLMARSNQAAHLPCSIGLAVHRSQKAARGFEPRQGKRLHPVCRSQGGQACRSSG